MTSARDHSTTDPAPARGAWPGVLTFCLALLALRLLYLGLFCPYTLIEDEAHYWEWSRNLDWSYYSKGPGIAWTIAAATHLLGESAFAVRAASPLFSFLTAVFLAGLAMDVARDRRAGLVAAALANLAPILQMTGLLMTIDMPYAACWSGACWAAWRALRGGGPAPFLALGLALAAGTLFKYTMLLLIPGVVGFALAQRRAGVRPPPARVLLTLAGAALGLVPILIWNARQDWPTVRHLLGHLGVAGGDVRPTQGAGRGWTYDPAWTLQFLGAQVGLLGPMLAIMAAGAFSRAAGSLFADRGRAFLLWCAAPIIFFYLAVSFVAEPEGNWALAGYLSLIPLAAAVVVDVVRRHRETVREWLALPPPRPKRGFLRRRPESPLQVLWHATLALGIASGLLMLRADFIESGLGALGAGEKVRRAVPLSRLMGADVQALHVSRLLAGLRDETGQEPFVIAAHYGRASQQAFYLPGRPRGMVTCASARLGGRRTQYDYWPQTSLDDPARLGRPAVLLGAAREDWEPVFERVVEVGTLEGDRKRGRPAFLGYGYRGWNAP